MVAGASAIAAQPPELFESAGKLPPFTSFGADIEQPGALAKAAAEIAYKKEIFLVCGDGSAYASPTALNTVLQLYALRIRHVLYMSDGPEACARLRRAVPTLACAWSSIINTSKPAHDSVLVRKWWDMRFYFYNVRKHILSRLAGELGYNVMQTDTDVAWFANPYPALKHGPMGEHQLISQPDLPLANAGVVYAQNIKSKSDPAAWVLNELIERIRAFSFHPDIVPRVLPWAKPPYFSNADEQSLMNDVLASAISGQPCFIFSTAIMEVKYGGTKRTKGFVWEKTPEAMTKPKLMALVRSRNERHDYKANACCHPAGLRVCTLPRGSAKRNVSSFSYHLNSWRIGTPPDAARLSAYSSPSSSSSAAATPPSFATAAAAIAAAAAADKAAADADASAAAGASRYAKGPNWLFQHYTHFDAKDAHKPQPRAAALLAAAKPRLRAQRAANASLDEPMPFGTFAGLPPVYMVHLAALRRGAWERRGVLRAHGWWHPQADKLAADALKWNQRARGYLLLSGRNVVRTSAGKKGVYTTELDALIGNMLILAALSGRVLVVPEVQCDTLVVDSLAAHWKETRRRRQERRCAWVPPKPCWQLEYMTTLELQRKASLDPTLARRLKLLRNRTDTHLARLNASSGNNGGVPIASASTRAARRKVESAACEAGGALASVLTLAPRGASRAGADTNRSRVAQDGRAIARMRALQCERTHLAALEDHTAEDRLRRRRLKPTATILNASAPRQDASARLWKNVAGEYVTAALARGEYDPRAADWLLRDAKCIDELLKPLKSGGAAG